MCKNLKKAYQKYCYSEDTHNILNLLTLEIKDKEIAKEYELYRIQRFNHIFWPVVLIFTLYNVFGWLSYFGSDGELASALRPAHMYISALIMLIPRYCCNRYSPQSWILACCPTLIMTQLAFRGYLPGHDTPQ